MLSSTCSPARVLGAACGPEDSFLSSFFGLGRGLLGTSSACRPGDSFLSSAFGLGRGLLATSSALEWGEGLLASFSLCWPAEGFFCSFSCIGELPASAAGGSEGFVFCSFNTVASRGADTASLGGGGVLWSKAGSNPISSSTPMAGPAPPPEDAVGVTCFICGA